MQYKNFYIGNVRYTFVKSRKTPLRNHYNDVDLLGMGSDTGLTIPFSEMEHAIEELQKSGSYQGVSATEHEKEVKQKEAEYMEKCNAIFEERQKEVQEKKKELEEKIERIKEYCKAKDVVLVYNKLEECIQDGYFMVWTYKGHKCVRLETIGL